MSVFVKPLMDWLMFGVVIETGPKFYMVPCPIFHGPVILSYISRLFDACTSYFGIMNQYDPTFDLNINVWTSYFRIVGQYNQTFDLKVNVSDLYFMVQWFCLISWRLFDACTSNFGIMNQYDLNINVGHCDIFMVPWFCLVSWRLFDVWTPLFGIMNQSKPCGIFVSCLV